MTAEVWQPVDQEDVRPGDRVRAEWTAGEHGIRIEDADNGDHLVVHAMPGYEIERRRGVGVEPLGACAVARRLDGSLVVRMDTTGCDDEPWRQSPFGSWLGWAEMQSSDNPVVEVLYLGDIGYPF